jgi:hypothetical protein
MYRLPTKVIVDELEFNIRDRGDFRMVLDCFKALQDAELSEDYRVLASLLIFYNEFNDLDDLREYEPYLQELVKEMFKFINGGEDSSPGAERDVTLVDWEQDSQMVCAAVNNVAKQEIRSIEYLHWWTFLGYYMSVGQSVLPAVVGIRDKIAHHKKLDDWEKEFKKNNPKYFIWRQTAQEQELNNLVRDSWNTGGC